MNGEDGRSDPVIGCRGGEGGQRGRVGGTKKRGEETRSPNPVEDSHISQKREHGGGAEL